MSNKSICKDLAGSCKKKKKIHQKAIYASFVGVPLILLFLWFVVFSPLIHHGTIIIPQIILSVHIFSVSHNLVPRVLRLYGQRLVARSDSGVLEFNYCRISAVKQWKPLHSLYRAANHKI